MMLSRLVLSLSTALLGGGFLLAAAPAQAASWSVSVGGYGSGYHYNVGYHDYGRYHRSHRHFRPVTGQRYRPARHYYGGFYHAPRYYANVGHYWRPSPAYVGYYAAPVVVHDAYYGPRYTTRYAPVRHERGVRYYNHRPTPRAGYDRVGYGDQYRGPDASYRYQYDELDEDVTYEDATYEDRRSYETYPEDAPGRIERR